MSIYSHEKLELWHRHFWIIDIRQQEFPLEIRKEVNMLDSASTALKLKL